MCHFTHTNYYLLKVNCTSFNTTYSLGFLSDIRKAKQAGFCHGGGRSQFLSEGVRPFRLHQEHDGEMVPLAPPLSKSRTRHLSYRLIADLPCVHVKGKHGKCRMLLRRGRQRERERESHLDEASSSSIAITS